MKSLHIKTGLLFAALVGVLGFSACEKEDPHHNHDNEEYDAIKIHLIAINDAGVQTTDTLHIDLDAHGTATPALTTVNANGSYRMLIEMYAHDHNINDEIIADADDHQFFFFASPNTAVSNYVYNDANIGLDGKINFANAGAFQLQALLRHGLDKTHADAQQYNSINYQNAGGSNDVNITLELKAE